MTPQIDDMKFVDQRLSPAEFAVIKEYLRVGGTYKGISDVTGLAPSQIKEVDRTRFYKDYMHRQDQRVIEDITMKEKR